MREIKFKAYIKKSAIVVPVQRINFDCSTVEVRLDEGDLWEFDFEEVELMEFTGLRDKNGNDIYESDIIRYSTDPFGQKGTFTYSVIFAQGQFRTERSTLWAVHLVCEVVGNVWENHELGMEKEGGISNVHHKML